MSKGKVKVWAFCAGAVVLALAGEPVWATLSYGVRMAAGGFFCGAACVWGVVYAVTQSAGRRGADRPASRL